MGGGLRFLLTLLLWVAHGCPDAFERDRAHPRDNHGEESARHEPHP